jgi:hypothetical protein
MTEILLSGDFSKLYSDIKERSNKGEGDASVLLKIIDNGIEKLDNNHLAGQKIQKKLWPDHYSEKYGIRNLWRLRLDSYWRLIYTLLGTKIKIMAVVLEVLDHKKYNRRFGYK